MKGLNPSRRRAGHGRPGFPAVAVLAALLFCPATPLRAVELPVTGVVRDSGGAVVPGADVALHPHPEPTPEKETGAVLVGTVEDWRGRPVAGAEVCVFLAGRPWSSYLDRRDRGYGCARSGPDGRFAVSGLEPRYELTAVAVHPEHPPVAVEIDEPESSCTTPGHPVPIRVTLPRGGRVRGRVVDAAGRPLAGAEITLASHELSGGAPYLEPVPVGALTALTGDNGAFRLSGVPPGPAAIAVEATGRATRMIVDLDVPVGVLDLGALVLGDEAAISGRVVDTRGEPVVGVEVNVFYTAGDLERRVGERRLAHRRFTLPPTDGAGGFRVDGLEPGTQVGLHVEPEGFFPQVLSAVAPTEEPVELVVTPAARLEGRVVDEGGRAVARAQVVARSEEVPEGTATDSAWTDEEGRFVLGRLEAGSVVLGMGPGAHILPAPETVRVAAGETVRGVELRVATGLVVSGRVVDSAGEPIRRARVGCRDCRGIGSDQTDLDGRYRIEGLRPGAITLYASMDGYLGTLAETEVGPGDATLDLVLKRGVSVSGRVVRATGEPAGGVVVRLVGEPDDPSTFLEYSSVQDLTAPDGSFELLGVGAGELRFTLSAPEEPLTDAVAWWFELPDSVTVAGAPVTGLEVRLPHLAAIRGRILGLGPDELAYVGVSVASAEPEAPAYLILGKGGTVSPDGSFEVLDLLAGRYELAAVLPDGRRTSAPVEILEGEPEVRADLAFDR